MVGAERLGWLGLWWDGKGGVGWEMWGLDLIHVYLTGRPVRLHSVGGHRPRRIVLDTIVWTIE